MTKFNFTKTILIAVSSVALLASAAPSAFAKGGFAATHPRRAEVNGRLANQNRRIDNEVRSGQLTQTQANVLHHDDHQVRQEERDMASQDGGHITKLDKKALNQQENTISRDIGH